MELNQLTAHEVSELMRDGKATPNQVVASILERIDEVEGKVNAYAFLNKKRAKDSAREIEDKFRGRRLCGIPVAIKANICVEGEQTSCGSRMLENFIPPYSATVIKKLEADGAIFLGKTNMDEFAFGSSTETSFHGPTMNPWSLGRVPGGSSGGSTAAVAADETIMALGSDTGGSIRQPAALCGVVGLKPTYGRVSRFGLVAFASSLDQIGPITKDVEDCARLLGVIAGYDPLDSTSVDLPVPDYKKSLIKDVKGLKIGIPKEYFAEGIDEEVETSVRNAIKLLKDLGAECEDVSLPHTEFAISVYYILATAEASSNLARYDGVRYGYRASGGASMDMYLDSRSQSFGPEVKRRIILGTFSLSSGYYEAYYLKAQKVRTLIKEDFDKAFEKFDVLITPTSPTPAFKIGAKIDDPLKMYLSDIFTISTNLAGIPGISIPCGFTEKGLPIGLQILARPFAEATILKVAYTYEQNTDWHKQKPRI